MNIVDDTFRYGLLLHGSCRLLSYVGVDLAGVAKRPTGFCILRGTYAMTELLYVNDEIVEGTVRAHPVTVAIDAPRLCRGADTAWKSIVGENRILRNVTWGSAHCGSGSSQSLLGLCG
jgi:hypothetical protein